MTRSPRKSPKEWIDLLATRTVDETRGQFAKRVGIGPIYIHQLAAKFPEIQKLPAWANEKRPERGAPKPRMQKGVRVLRGPDAPKAEKPTRVPRGTKGVARRTKRRTKAGAIPGGTREEQLLHALGALKHWRAEVARIAGEIAADPG